MCGFGKRLNISFSNGQREFVGLGICGTEFFAIFITAMEIYPFWEKVIQTGFLRKFLWGQLGPNWSGSS